MAGKTPENALQLGLPEMVALRVPLAEWVGVGGAPGDGDEVLGLLDEHHQHPARPPVARVRPGGRGGVGRRGADLWRRDELEGDDDLAAVAAVGAGGQRRLRQRGGGGRGGEGERHGSGGWRGGRRLGGGVAIDDQVGLEEWWRGE